MAPTATTAPGMSARETLIISHATTSSPSACAVASITAPTRVCPMASARRVAAATSGVKAAATLAGNRRPA